jgi:hypothetical protein
MFDAYTIKKVMPKLVIAAILIQLSWEITTFALDLTANIAWGLQGLLYSPFGGRDAFQFQDLVGATGDAFGFTSFAVAGALAASFAAISVGFVFMLALSAFLGILIAFIMLAVRELVLIVLIVLSPVAFVAWILPNTEKIWKLWWESFSKLLLVYPLILLIIAAGQIFAKITIESQGRGGVSDVFIIGIAVLGFFGPYYLIPKTFQVAGSAFANITGMVNDKSRGVFDRLKKGRQQSAAKTFDKFKTGERFNRSNVLARGVNRVGAGVGVGKKGNFGIGRKGEQARANLAQVTGARNAKENEQLQQLALNSDEGIAIMGLSGGTAAGGRQAADQLMQGWLRNNQQYQDAVANGDAEEQQRIEAEAAARRDRGFAAAQAVGFSRRNAESGMSHLMQNKARAVGSGDWDTIQEGIDRLHGNNAEAAANLAGTAQYHARQSGRFDLGNDTATGGVSRASLYQLANAHPNTIDGWGAEAVAAAQVGAISGNTDMINQAAVARLEMEQAIPNATGDTRDALLRQMDALDQVGVGGFLNNASGRIDPATGRQRQVQVRENFTAGATGWSAADRARGWRMQPRDETNRDYLSPSARTYQRPDENNI